MKQITEEYIPELLSKHPGVGYGLEGASQEEVNLIRNLSVASIAALFLIYALIAILVPLSAVGTGGFDSWQGFAKNSLADSRPSFNQMGLKAIVSHRAEAQWEALIPMGVASYDAWRAAREGAFRERRFVFAAAVLVCLVPIALAVAREEDWVGAVLGLGLLSVVFLLQCYNVEMVCCH